MATETEELVDVTLDDPKPKDGEIEAVVDKPKPKDDVVVVKDKEPAAKIIEPDEGIAILKKNLEQSETARLAAEKQAREQTAVAVRATNEVQDTQLTLVKNAIETVKQSSESLKARYREARAAGDVDAEYEVQQQISANAARMLQLEQGKTALEARPKQEVPKVTDPVEALASQLTPRSADWVRKHPEFARDARLNSKMIAAHNLAVADGIAADSDDYFAAIEDTLKLTKRDPVVEQHDEPTEVAAKVVQRRSSPAAAPVSRSGNGDGSRPNVVRLTSQEVEMAEMMGMTASEYARNKVALQKEGKLQ